QRHNAHQMLFPVQYRKAAHLYVTHIGEHMVGILVLIAIFDVTTHDIGDPAIRPLAHGNRPDRDIAVGDHADEPAVVANRDGASINFSHRLGSTLDCVAGIGQAHVRAHAIVNFHDFLHLISTGT